MQVKRKGRESLCMEEQEHIRSIRQRERGKERHGKKIHRGSIQMIDSLTWKENSQGFHSDDRQFNTMNNHTTFLQENLVRSISSTIGECRERQPAFADCNRRPELNKLGRIGWGPDLC
ncbi:hypothetical protein SLA2020_208170 [Shorea laevis]